MNRTGSDANGLEHDGGSVILSATGETIASLPDRKEGIATAEIGLPALRRFREKFPAWKDADVFRL